jgi:hypothetical protein
MFMVNTEANLLRTSAAILQDAMRVESQFRKLGAGKDRIADAEENALNAGRLLNLAILRWLKTL